MTEKEKQLLFTDLCARLPYGVILDNGVKLRTIDALTKVISGDGSDRNIEFVKPYLRPMSSMTVHERREYFELTKREILDDGYVTDNSVVNVDDVDKFIDWLNAHHFDYRGLIEKGIAIEAPEDMYKF